MATEDIYLPEGDFENPLLKQQGYGLLKPSTGSTFDAGLELGKMDAPMNYLEDLNRYNKAEEAPNKLSPEEANKQYGIPNYLNFDRDISPDAARVIQERTWKRIGLEDRLNRASSAQSVAGLGGQFIGQMFDPINLGASFIPVTKIPGASSLLMGLATSNPFTRRAVTGAIEGIVGQAVIEPIYTAGDYLNFEDHTASDVMRNLAFGAAFGAGAHIVFGGAYDGAKFLYGKTKSTHQNAAMTAINQMLDGAPIDVTPILRADPEFARTEALRTELANIERTGNYSGPESYNYFESVPTGFGTEGPAIRSAGDPIISGNIPGRTAKYDIQDISGELTPANLGGSNKAYIANTASGPMYVKLQRSGPEPINQNRVKSEMLANNLYQLFGDDLIVPANLVRVNGELGVATPFYEGAEKVSAEQLAARFLDDPETPIEELNQIRNIAVNSVLDMFLGNRDAFAFGNIVKVDGQYKKIDQGGALLYRAMGEQKDDFGPKIKEISSMTDEKVAPDAAKFLTRVLDREALEEGVLKVLSTDIDKIIDNVLAAGFSKDEQDKVLGILATRYTTLQKMFPDQAKEAAKKQNKLSVADTFSAYKLVVDQSRHFNKKLAKLTEKDKSDIQSAIALYQGTAYSKVNGYLRTGQITADQDGKIVLDGNMTTLVKETISSLDKASELGKLEKAAQVYRWMPANGFHPNVDKGFMSTSVFAERSPFHVDENQFNNLLVVVHAPEGTKGFWPDAANMTSDQRNLTGSFSVSEAGEYEFVIGRGQKYEIMAPATDKTSVKGREYKEIHIRLLGEEPAESLRPITLKELTAGATAYHNQPSAAAEVEVFLPPEAVTFNSVVADKTKLGDKFGDPEIEALIADLEANAKMVLTPEELKATLESFDKTIKEVDDYVSGMNQAFVCWKNG